jgi:hypothetical protein
MFDCLKKEVGGSKEYAGVCVEVRGRLVVMFLGPLLVMLFMMP